MYLLRCAPQVKAGDTPEPPKFAGSILGGAPPKPPEEMKRGKLGKGGSKGEGRGGLERSKRTAGTCPGGEIGAVLRSLTSTSRPNFRPAPALRETVAPRLAAPFMGLADRRGAGG